MSAMPREREVLEKLGFSLMPPGRALAAMEAALAARRPLSLIADMDWEKFQVFVDFCLQPSLFTDVAVRRERSDLARPGMLDAIRRSPPEKAREMIEKVVRMELRSVSLIESSDTIDADQRFNFMGIDSLMALSLAAALESYFRFEVPSTLAYNYPTIRLVTDFLLNGLTGVAPSHIAPVPASPPAAPRWLRALNDSPGAPALCCLPYAGSGVSAFHGLAAALAGQVQVTGVQTPGREDHDHVPAFRRMQALIPELVEALSGLDEYVLYGHSMGAAVAFELALALQNRGRQVPRALIVSGSNPPAPRPAPHVHELPHEDFVAEVLSTYAGVAGNEARELAVQKNQDLLRADIELFETYRPSTGRLRIPVIVIHCRDDPFVGFSEMHGWGRLTDGDFLLQTIDGGHGVVAERPEELAKCLRKAMSLIG
jgi:surfactin synthase thioesterase subunit/acyl carrier protein